MIFRRTNILISIFFSIFISIIAGKILTEKLSFLNHFFNGGIRYWERVIKPSNLAATTSALALGILLIYYFPKAQQISVAGILNRIFSSMNSSMRYLPTNKTSLSLSRNSKEVRFAMKNGGEIGGLSNDGNTCFMNSVLQSLASSKQFLRFIDSYLYDFVDLGKDGSSYATKSDKAAKGFVFTHELRKILEKVNGAYGDRGKEFSAKSLLNRMPNGPKQNFLTGYNQEDAQEFYQLLMAIVEKEYKDSVLGNNGASEKKEKASDKFVDMDEIPDHISGCEKLGRLGNTYVPASQVDPNFPNGDRKLYPLHLMTPADGVFVERIGCLKCGESGGIRYSVISGLNLHLSERGLYNTGYSLDDMVKDWTKPEIIEDVNCNRCGLAQTKEFLENKLKQTSNDIISTQFRNRIEEIDRELSQPHITDDSFERLSIKQMIHKTKKSKQIFFSRPPPLLTIHINRSVFDPRTYMIVKNSSKVSYPLVLDLSPHIIEPKDINMDARVPFKKCSANDDAKEEHNESDLVDKVPNDGISNGDQEDGMSVSESNSATTEPSGNILGNPKLGYNLKAVISHYGTHNYGHYICYRKLRGSWWRVSDESVYVVTEEEALNAHGTFMLFYEYNDGIVEKLQQLADEDDYLQNNQKNGEENLTNEENASASNDSDSSVSHDRGTQDTPTGASANYNNSNGYAESTNESLPKDYSVEEISAYHM